MCKQDAPEAAMDPHLSWIHGSAEYKLMLGEASGPEQREVAIATPALV